MGRPSSRKRTQDSTAPALEKEVAFSPASAGWIVSPFWDSVLFIAAPLVAMAGLLPLRAYWSSQQLSVFLLAFFTFGHHFPGFLRAYGDRELLARYRWRFLLAPPLLFATTLWFDIRNLHGLLIFISAWDIWHVLMQNYGFMRIYDSKQGDRSKLTSRMDWTVAFSWYLMLIVSSPHYRHDLLRRGYSAGLPLIPPEVLQTLEQALTVWTALATLAYVAYHIYQWREGRPVSWRKFLLLGIFLGATFYLYVYINDFLVGFGVWSAFHCIQYYGIVWVFNQNRVAKSASAMTPFIRFLFRPSVGLALLYAGLILAYGSVNYFVSFVSDAGWRRLLMAFTFTSTALHYYYDGFIWKVREPETRAYLNIGTEAKRSFAAASKAVAGAFQQLQPANNGRLQLAYLSAIVLILATTETWWPHAEISMRQSLVALAPGAGEAHFNLGDALWKQGRSEEAIDSFREAVRLLPNSPEARNNLGAVLQESGQLDEAIAEYRQALALSGGSDGVAGQSTGSPILPSAWLGQTGDAFAAHSNLADALAKTNRQEEAIEHYRIALQRDPLAVKVRTNLGATLSALERYDEAVRELNEVLATEPGYAAAHINLASILEFQGKTDEAVWHYEAVLKGNDERAAESARGSLERLRTVR